MDVLAQVLPADDVTLTRLQGWVALGANNVKTARAKFAPLQDRDALSGLGMVFVLRAEANPAAPTGPTTAPSTLPAAPLPAAPPSTRPATRPTAPAARVAPATPATSPAVTPVTRVTAGPTTAPSAVATAAPSTRPATAGRLAPLSTAPGRPRPSRRWPPR